MKKQSKFETKQWCQVLITDIKDKSSVSKIFKSGLMKMYMLLAIAVLKQCKSSKPFHPTYTISQTSLLLSQGSVLKMFSRLV